MLATATLMATERMRTLRRSEAKLGQEGAVAGALVAAGFAQVPTPRAIRTLEEAPGPGRFTTLRRVVLPAAAPGLAAGLVLGMGRALSETAALLFTSGYVTRMPTSLGDSGRALSVHIYDLAMNVPGATERAYGTALVLVAILLVLNTVAVGLLRRWTHARTGEVHDAALA